MASHNGQQCNQTQPYANHANLYACLIFRTFGPATGQIRQTSRHHIELLEGHFSGKPADLRYTAILVIVVCTPAAVTAKKQLNRHQFPALLTWTTARK